MPTGNDIGIRRRMRAARTKPRRRMTGAGGGLFGARPKTVAGGRASR